MNFNDEVNAYRTGFVPYSIRVKTERIVKERNGRIIRNTEPDKKDPKAVKHENYTGRRVAIKRNRGTLDDLIEHGPGKFIEYVPAETVSMQIETQVISDESIKVVPNEENSTRTGKDYTQHSIQIKNSEGENVGYVILSLNPAGDITRKTCFYKAPKKSKRIQHIIQKRIIDNKVFTDENIIFIRDLSGVTRKIEAYQNEGKIVGASIEEFNNTKDGKDELPNKYIAQCVFDETDVQKRKRLPIPWNCACLENAILDYQRRLEMFIQHADKVKKETGKEYTIKNAIELAHMDSAERKKQGYKFEGNEGFYKNIAMSLLKKHTVFSGEYIGNILKLTDEGYKACIVTKHQKDERNYRLYTLIDFPGVNLVNNKFDSFYEILSYTQKEPTFVTEIGKDGKEKLVLYKGKEAAEECPEYDEFVREFISPFSGISPIKMGKFFKVKDKEER